MIEISKKNMPEKNLFNFFIICFKYLYKICHW